MLRVLIADDFPLFRLGVKEMLADGLGDVTVGECDNAQDLRELVRRKKWDVVILDITMPGTTGTEALKQLKEELPGLPVIVLSLHPEDQYAIRMFKAGADAYLTKASAPEELVAAIKKVCAGGRYVRSTIAEQLVSVLNPGTEVTLHNLLSDREFEVMRFLASGKTVSDIAKTMHLAVTTISTYRTRILQKLHLKNNAELMHYAVQQGIT